jgi:hypothetical protein
MNLRNLTLMFLCMVAAAAHAKVTFEEKVIPFNSEFWDLGKAKVENIDGRQAITGTAVLTGDTFENGIIEMELKTDSTRAFPGVTFRDDAAGNGESIYVRPHHSGQHDAIQYAPIFNNQTGWQLYYGEGYTASLNIPGNQWMTLRIEVKDFKARVFLNEMNSPVLLISTLKGRPGPGRIFISDGGKGVYLANFRMKKTSDLDFPETAAEPRSDGLLSWHISKSFAVDDPAGKNLSLLNVANTKWRLVEHEPSGLVNLSRYLPLVNGQPSSVYAKATLKSNKKKRVKLEFGYSDNITIFHNRNAIYSGKASFRSREPQFNGLVGYHDAIYLDLDKGENEILLQLTESLGGWGFMMRSVPLL